MWRKKERKGKDVEEEKGRTFFFLFRLIFPRAFFSLLSLSFRYSRLAGLYAFASEVES